MSSPPKSLVKSRENLQEIFKNPHGIIKYEIFDRVLLLLWGNIRQSLSKSVNYIINLCDPSYYGNIDYRFIFTEANILELIEILKREYPGVDFTYKETAGYDGKIIEQIIIMDWS
jgi:hypothetical protein